MQSTGTSLIIAATSIEKIGQSFKLTGIFNSNINGTNKNIKSSSYYVDQPNPWVISILSNELFNVVSKGSVGDLHLSIFVK